jgi:hypothetical protein
MYSKCLLQKNNNTCDDNEQQVSLIQRQARQRIADEQGCLDVKRFTFPPFSPSFDKMTNIKKMSLLVFFSCHVPPSKNTFFELVFENTFWVVNSSFFDPKNGKKNNIILFWEKFCWCKGVLFLFSHQKSNKK